MNRKLFSFLCALVFTLTLVCAAAADSTVVDTILTVGTTQSFKDDPVSADDLKIILQAGLAAESAINQQPWYFVAVTNPDVMKELAGGSAGGAMPSGGQMPVGAPAGGEGSFPGAPAEGSGGFPGAPAGGEGSFPGAPAGGFGDFSGMPAMPAGGGSAKAGFGDSPAAIIIYKSTASKSPNADYDCGLATQNMVLAAASLGYGVKIVSSAASSLNGANHDAICEKLGVDPSMQAVAILLIGYADDSVDAATGATTREALETKTTIIE